MEFEKGKEQDADGFPPELLERGRHVELLNLGNELMEEAEQLLHLPPPSHLLFGPLEYAEGNAY